MIRAEDVRRKYLEFQKSFGHVEIDRAPLVIKDDPTTLFTGAGMQPLLKYLLGEKHPDGRRLTDSQTCLRAQDIDEVGDTRHTTFFEMLGNWSLGDYFKREQISRIFTFLVDEVGLDPKKLYVTAFRGDEKNSIPRDDESAKIWQEEFAKRGIDAPIIDLISAENGDEKGMQGGRIFFYDDGENWWSRGGGLEKTPLGDPCGPDSEMFYDFGEEFHDASYGQPHPASDSPRFMEIGNQVFMQYKRNEDGTFSELKHKNVDFGAGLERIAAAAINSPDVFKISLFAPIIEKLEQLSRKTYDSNTVAMRVIADHLRAATFLAVDGVIPSNKEQGYVMRRLIRRAVRFAFDLGIEQNFLEEIVPVIADLYVEDYPEVRESRDDVVKILAKEEKAFRQTLRKGLKEFEKIAKNAEILTGEEIFTLYDTYGFPKELSAEEAFKREIPLSESWADEFAKKMEEQRNLSRTAAKGTFKGGLGGKTWEFRRYHTATHLLQSALREQFGDEIVQRGSNITEERLRFDFTLDHKMTDEEKRLAEDFVNEKIREDLPIWRTEYPTEDALKMGAIGPFGEKYGEKVRVYQMGEGDEMASLEICGGPHVERTGQLATVGELDNSSDAADSQDLARNFAKTSSEKMTRKFVILKEESSSAGIRRIKAILR